MTEHTHIRKHRQTIQKTQAQSILLFSFVSSELAIVYTYSLLAVTF